MPPSKSDIESIVQTAEKGSPVRRWLIWLAALLVAGGGIWYWTNTASRQSLPAYVTETVSRTDIVVQVTATGTVEPTGQVEISSGRDRNHEHHAGLGHRAHP